MISPQQLRRVIGFELRDAFRSKLVVIIVALLAGGSALSTAAFVKAFQAAEEAARQLIAKQNQVPADLVPMDEVKRQAIEGVIGLHDNEGVRQALIEQQPLAIFYGYVALLAVPLLVLTLSGGTLAADLQRGTARFSLVRCSRPTWALGKLLGHAALLGVGLLIGAGVAGALGAYMEPDFEFRTWSDLFIGAARAWIYGVTYLGIFSGVALVVQAPMAARAFSLLALIVCGLGHSVATSTWLTQKAALLSHARWFFPGQYEQGLWSAHGSANLLSFLALLTIGGAVFAGGTSIFMRRDA